MPYDDIPPAAIVYTFTVDLNCALVDDLELFDADAKAGGIQMLDFLDRVITDVKRDGESLGPKVRGHGIPYPELKKIFVAVGTAMKEANNAGN